MDNSVMIERVAKMAAIIGASPETVSRLKDEASKNIKQPSAVGVSVTVAKESESKDAEDKLIEMDDKAIDGLSEMDAKKMLKEVRDCVKKDEGTETEPSTPSSQPQKHDMTDIFSNIKGY